MQKSLLGFGKSEKLGRRKLEMHTILKTKVLHEIWKGTYSTNKIHTYIFSSIKKATKPHRYI